MSIKIYVLKTPGNMKSLENPLSESFSELQKRKKADRKQKRVALEALAQQANQGKKVSSGPSSLNPKARSFGNKLPELDRLYTVVLSKAIEQACPPELSANVLFQWSIKAVCSGLNIDINKLVDTENF